MLTATLFCRKCDPDFDEPFTAPALEDRDHSRIYVEVEYLECPKCGSTENVEIASARN